MYISYRAWERRLPPTQSLLLGLRQVASWMLEISLVSCSWRLVIHARAACRGRERAEEIRKSFLRSPATCGAARSWGGRRACLQTRHPRRACPLLICRRMDTFRARRRALHFLRPLRGRSRVSVFRSTALAQAERVSPSCVRCECWPYIQPQGELIPGCQIMLAGSIDLGEQPVEYLPTCSSMNPSHSSAKSCCRIAVESPRPGM